MNLIKQDHTMLIQKGLRLAKSKKDVSEEEADYGAIQGLRYAEGYLVAVSWHRNE